MSVIGKYIYGIVPRRSLSRGNTRDSGQVNSNGEELLSSCLLAEASAYAGGTTAFEEAYLPTKIFGVWVYTIPYQDISAVVSDSEIVDYTHMLKDGLARQLVTHQKVIEGNNVEKFLLKIHLNIFHFL